MNDKMKVWECTECDSACVIKVLSEHAGAYSKILTICPWSSHTTNWRETTRYEITERKPDYKSMAERGQIGLNKDGYICRLVNYLATMTTPFEVQYFGVKGTNLTTVFTPCDEPVELDPITMEKTK